jgi:hypothetical protein
MKETQKSFGHGLKRIGTDEKHLMFLSASSALLGV